MGSSLAKMMNVVLLIDRLTRPFDVTPLHFLDASGLNLDTRHHFKVLVFLLSHFSGVLCCSGRWRCGGMGSSLAKMRDITSDASFPFVTLLWRSLLFG